MKLNRKGIDKVFENVMRAIDERDVVFRKNSQDVLRQHIRSIEIELEDLQAPEETYICEDFGIDLSNGDHINVWGWDLGNPNRLEIEWEQKNRKRPLKVFLTRKDLELLVKELFPFTGKQSHKNGV